MKKLVKLLLLAAVLVGAVIGLIFIVDSTDRRQDDDHDINSDKAKEWQAKINDLCKDGKWTTSGYENIESGIHTDRVSSEGNLLSKDEETALQKYLFTSSCAYIGKHVDNLFKMQSYPAGSVSSAENNLAFLTKKAKEKEFDTNSYLSEASGLISEYHQLTGSFTVKSGATYSRPLKPFNRAPYEAAKARVTSLKHYNSHFSKNKSIRDRVGKITSNLDGAENAYYDALERAIENHYRASGNLVQLLDDQISFNEISTNYGAKSRLDSFVKHSYR